jgi:hypothetical protein
MTVIDNRHLRMTGLLACLAAAPAAAHHPGGTGNASGAGPINTIAGTTLEQGALAVSLLYEHTRLRTLSDGALLDGAAREEHLHSMRSIASPAIGIAYGLTKDLTVSLRIPYVARRGIREGEHEDLPGGGVELSVVPRGDADGFGDVSALAQYRFLDRRASGTELALLAGVKAPTGATNRRDHNGALFELEFQPGTGAWDWMLGLAASQQAGRTSFHASVLQTWVSSSQVEGLERTDLGNRFQYNVAVVHRLIGANGGHSHNGNGPMYAGLHRHSHATKSGHDHGPHNHSHSHDAGHSGPKLDVMLELNGEYHKRQVEGGVVDLNSGGNVLYLAPGVRLSQDRWSAFASVGVPIVNDLNGIQSEPSWRLVTGVSVSF